MNTQKKHHLVTVTLGLSGLLTLACPTYAARPRTIDDPFRAGEFIERLQHSVNESDIEAAFRTYFGKYYGFNESAGWWSSRFDLVSQWQTNRRLRREWVWNLKMRREGIGVTSQLNIEKLASLPDIAVEAVLDNLTSAKEFERLGAELLSWNTDKESRARMANLLIGGALTSFARSLASDLLAIRLRTDYRDALPWEISPLMLWIHVSIFLSVTLATVTSVESFRQIPEAILLGGFLGGTATGAVGLFRREISDGSETGRLKQQLKLLKSILNADGIFLSTANRDRIAELFRLTTQWNESACSAELTQLGLEDWLG